VPNQAAFSAFALVAALLGRVGKTVGSTFGAILPIVISRKRLAGGGDCS
jgi:hypothetical protein